MRNSPLLVLLFGACGGEMVGQVSQADSKPPQCAKESVEGVDVYAGNGDIDWAQVKQSGRAFVFIKATQGDYNVQDTFAAHLSGAHANAIMASPYHFFDPTIDGVAQAKWFLDALSKAGGLLPSDLPPMLDLECPTSSDPNLAGINCEGTGASGWVPSETLKQRVSDWLQTVEQAVGRTPIIYGYYGWFYDVGFNDTWLMQYPLFIASYNPCAYVPEPWLAATFWQYTTNGRVPGIPHGEGLTDLDRFFGPLDALMAFNATTMVDASTPSDMAAAHDGGAPLKRRHGCQIGASAASSNALPWLALLFSLGFAARRRRTRDTV